MITIKQAGHYQTSENFLCGTGDSAPSRVRHFEPGQAAREQLILEKLGTNGWGRWQYFRQCFSGGWGETKNQPLSPKSQEMLFAALRILNFKEGVRPSLFLTDEGFLELAWRDEDGKAIQIEFGPKESEIYVEATETELTFPNEELQAVIDKTL